jgi:nucleotide-binding universal stress UspA family protein
MRILVCVGRNSECADPLGAAASLPWPATALFSVLTVSELIHAPAISELVPAAADVTDVQAEADASVKRIADSAAVLLTDRGFQATAITRQGDPEKVIVDYASEMEADLIVVGSCEKSRLERFMLGSVSQSIVKHAPCSVLVVKPDSRDNR